MASVQALFLVVIAALPAPAQGDRTFELTYLTLAGRRQDTVHYDFDGDGKVDLLNTSIDFDKTPPARWLGLHLNRGGRFNTMPDRLWSVSERASALVFGDFLPGGGVEVGYLAADGAWVYPEAGADPVKLLHARTFFRNVSRETLTAWQWVTDLDGDGRHDLVLPGTEGYRVYFQTGPGVFGRVADLEGDLRAGSPRVLAVSGRVDRSEILSAHFVSTRTLPRPEPVDINGDGLSDLAVVHGETVTCFFQEKPGVFPSRRPWRVSYRIPALAGETGKDKLSVSIVKFTDIDRDGLADLVVTRIEGQLGLWDSIKTGIYLHMGTGRGNFTADKRITIDGVSIDPEFIDMNGDGKLDAKTSRLRTDLVKQGLNAFVLGDVPISYEVFQYDPARKGFLGDPVYEKSIYVRKKDLEKTGAGAVPLVFIRGDVSGDGRPDQLEVDPKNLEMIVHPGVERGTREAPRIGFDPSAHWTVRLARHPDGLQVMDVNGDGMNDVVLYHAGMLGLALAGTR
jgi:hypothetical protein